VKQEKNALLNQAIISLNHEINNPLSVISMEAQLLQRKLEDKEDKIESRIARIEKNIDRIKVILERISTLNADNLRPVEYIDGREMLNLHEH
jgi:nitrogen-specific signal transduction histidine kinase